MTMLDSTPVAATVAVEATGITKRFGSTTALRGVDLRLEHGKCLGLVGRNGAGKSTLVSILSGLYPPDTGTVTFAGEAAPSLGDIAGWRRNIATVFQHSAVVPSLSVAENVFLNAYPKTAAGAIDWAEMRRSTSRVMAEWGFDVDAKALCSEISVEQRQIVEIARALASGNRCLLLDEPTAALERGAVSRLFERIRQLVANGVAVLYISHHLEEVFEICDDVDVIRDGSMVLSRATKDLTQESLVAAMVGDDVRIASRKLAREAALASSELRSTSDDRKSQTPRLVLDHVNATFPGGGSIIDLSLEIRPGERLGITGLLGNGVATLGRVVAGAVPYQSGSVTIDGELVPSGRLDKALKIGVGYVPEDRRAAGFVAMMGVGENATMTILDRLAKVLGFVMPSRRNRAALPLVERLSLVSSGLGQPVGELSGGNQQKVTVARAIARDPKVIVAITPTRGVDVASKELLLESLAEIADETKAALLLATDELDDLVVCERVLVIVRGKIFKEFTEPPFERDELIAASEGLETTAMGEQ